MKPLSRRSVLISAAAATTAAMACVAWRFSDDSSDDYLSQDLSKVFAGYKLYAASVGESYLQCTPHEADPIVLARLLKIDGRRLPKDPVLLRRYVRDRIRQDFAEGQTTDVNGWILSSTEARLCAMTAIAARADA
jgi:hypothetical protein